MSAQPSVAMRSQERPLRLGFLGLGWIGRMRLDAVAQAPNVAVAALADSDPAKLAAAHNAYSSASAASDIDALLECELDGVVIATPNAAHAAQAIACLERGAPVFCQKPLAISFAQAREVIEAARRADRLLGVDFSYRHVRGMDELRRRIAAGEFGELLALDLTFHNAYGPDKSWVFDRALSGGGCLLDLGVHLIDLALWLQNATSLELVSSQLFAQARPASRNGPVEDMAYAEFRTQHGGVVRIACSWHAHAGCDAVIGMELLGSAGGASWRNVNGSFFDFTLDVFKGRARERIAAPPDAWGARALQAWSERLQHDASYDPEAQLIAHGAQLIDEIYARS